jgi:hypothetical protein
MAKFRRKPVVIDAVQFDFSADVWPDGVERPADNEKGIGYGYINTLKGRMIASNGDWIITGVKGEMYPCKPDIFEATYGAVEEVSREAIIDYGASIVLKSALKKLTDQKSSERTAKDRYIAIAVTDLEKLIAFVDVYC